MKNYFFLLLGFLLTPLLNQAQIPCTDLDNPPGCQLCTALYQGSTDGFTADTLAYNFPCGNVENSQWHSVTASSERMTINFSNLECFIGTGIEFAVFDSNYQPVSDCFSLNNNLVTEAIVNDLVPGATYFILIDGIDGSKCDFAILINENKLLDVPKAEFISSGLLPIVICGEIFCLSASREQASTKLQWEVLGSNIITSGGTLEDTFICVQFDPLDSGIIILTPINQCKFGSPILLDVFIFPNDAIIIDTIICHESCIDLPDGNCYSESQNLSIAAPCGTISRVNISHPDTSNFEITCLVDSFTNSIAFNWSDLGADNFDIFINDVFQTTQSFSSYLLPFNQISGDEIKIKVIPSSILGCSFKTSETICKFNNPTNSTQQISSERINIFPNPTSNIVEITSEIPIEKVSVFDLSGRLILESFDEKIDLSGYGSGVYFFKIKTLKGISIKKIVFL